MKHDFLQKMRDGEPLSAREQISMIVQLSFPAILAQISTIIMNYIDASMVGRLGSTHSASIGLVSSSLWLFNSVCSAIAIGFTVQVAQRIGAKQDREARSVMGQGFIIELAFTILLAVIGVCISPVWPHILGGTEEICSEASAYFMIFACFLPVSHMMNLAGGMLQASGNMKVPSLLHVAMCLLDVVFNLLLIFPSRKIGWFTLPGAGLGVVGAALGTGLAQLTTAIFMLFFLLRRSPMLSLRPGEKLAFSGPVIRRALRLSLPVAAEGIISCGAQVVSTTIVAPLGTVSIAANSFSITAESLCYMSCYGISSASTTLIGQSIGANRTDLTRRLGWLCALLGIGVMTLTGFLLYLLAPWMIGILSIDPEVIALGTTILRIEAFAEPFYGASIVVTGVLRGAGDTLIPSLIQLLSMWCIRLPIASVLSKRIGLRGVWIAMALELSIRGILFIFRLIGKRWSDPEHSSKLSRRSKANEQEKP